MFPWFLNKCDSKDNYYKYLQVLWTFKWVINAVTDFPAISLSKIEGLREEFERRFQEYGTGDRVINYFKAQQESQLGNIEKSLELADKYFSDTRTCELDDCAACQPNNISRVFFYHGHSVQLLCTLKVHYYHRLCKPFNCQLQEMTCVYLRHLYLYS